MKTIRLSAVFTVLLIMSFICSAQNSKPRSLLSGKIISEIIGEASGERAMNHINELAAYNHDRLTSEYKGPFIETEYFLSKLKEYELEGIILNKYPGGTAWDGISGEIWEVSPGISKIADYGDVTAMLAQGSTDSDVTAELVWVGEGRQDDIERADVKGKIVVTSGRMASVNSLSVSKGAFGVISYESPHPLSVPLAIPFHTSNFTISGNSKSTNSATANFGFFLPPREGIILRDRLLAKEKIIVHAVIKTQNVNYNLEVISCLIKGTDPAAGEIILSAHLFDGLVKMGGNDNLSGCAAILEIARMFNSMIKEGRIERPIRTIRFIWAPEISGTGPWVRENMDIIKNSLCNINLDMVGLWLSKSQSLLYLHRTTFGNPHYINDIMANYYDFVGSGNRYGLGISGSLNRIVSPTGSDDPFYYIIDDHAGGSDHEVFNDWGVQVPAVMMLTWPDPYYHTSLDNADKCDPTQLKRVCVIGAAAVYTIAWADEQMASKIAVEVAGNSLGRLGKQLTRAMDEIDKVKKDEFENCFKKTKGYIEAALINELATLASTAELATNSTHFNEYLARLATSIEITGKASITAFESYSETLAKALGLPGIIFKPSELEQKAKKIIPKMSNLVISGSYLGHIQVLNRLDPKVKEKFPVKGRILDSVELCRLCNGKNTALEIKKMLDAQLKQGENDLQNVINYIYILKEAGLVTL